MKNSRLILMLFVALITFASCSKDDPKDTPSNGGNAKSWKMYDGDFITAEDVIVSNDSTNLNVSKAYLAKLKGKEKVAVGDIISLFTHGYLNYFQVNSVAENGDSYMSIGVKEVSLNQVLSALNINLKNVQISTDVYMDQTKPKRVNNSGEADSKGLINTEAYIETDANGNKIIHPMACLVPAYRKGANFDEEGSAIPGAYVGCYIGQADNYEAANSWFDSFVDVVKDVGSAVISPVKAVVSAVELAVDCGEFLAKLAVGGEMIRDTRIIDLDHEFTGQRWDLTSGQAAKRTDSGENSKPIYVKEEWKDSVKAKVYATLNGHIKAHAGLRMVLDFSPLSVDKFEYGAYANLDLDMNAVIEAGVKIQETRPVSLKRFAPKEWMGDIGPIPILIVVYPEFIWNTQITGEYLAYFDFDAKVKFDYDAAIQFIPEIKPIVHKCEHPTGDNIGFSFNKFGVKGEGSASTGLFLRLSAELYGIAGPVFDLGSSLNIKGNVDIFKEKDEPWNAKGDLMLIANYAEMRTGGAIGFPPLKDVSPWLYEKLSFHTNNLIPSIAKADTLVRISAQTEL